MSHNISLIVCLLQQIATIDIEQINFCDTNMYRYRHAITEMVYICVISDIFWNTNKKMKEVIGMTNSICQETGY